MENNEIKQSKGLKISSIIFAILALVFNVANVFTFATLQGFLHGSEEPLAIVLGGIIFIVLFIVTSVFCLIFSIVSLVISAKQLSDYRNWLSIILFVISLIEVILPLVLVVILFL